MAVADFCAITGVDEATAARCLAQHGGNLELAVNAFFGGDVDMEPAPAAAPQARAPAPAAGGPDTVYWEKQGADKMCAMHTLNSLCQGPLFTESELSTIGPAP